MSFRPTCCPQGYRRSKREINGYVYSMIAVYWFVSQRDHESVRLLLFRKLPFPPFPARWRVGHDYFLILVFAAMRSSLALRPVLFDPKRKMAKLLKYIEYFAKTGMDYSCHGVLRGIYVGLG